MHLRRRRGAPSIVTRVGMRKGSVKGTMVLSTGLSPHWGLSTGSSCGGGPPGGDRGLGHRTGFTGQNSVREAGGEVFPGQASVSVTGKPVAHEGAHHARANMTAVPATAPSTGRARSWFADTVLSTTA
jgi:hypothetical protein